MGLDIRLPIGGMFFIVGLLLTVYGLATAGDQTYEKSLNINVNLWWGLAMLVFGVLFLAFGIRGAGKIKHGTQESPEAQAIEAREHEAGLEV
jgi:membrane-bound ClpP family serine protease